MMLRPVVEQMRIPRFVTFLPVPSLLILFVVASVLRVPSSLSSSSASVDISPSAALHAAQLYPDSTMSQCDATASCSHWNRRKK